MKKGLKFLAVLLSVILVSGNLALPVEAASSDYKISRVGSKNRTVYAGQEFELSVKKVGTLKLKDSQIKWSIKDTSIVGFDDDDRYDNDIELRAKKAGTTTITAKNLVTGGKIYYKVTVKKAVSPNKMVRVGSSSVNVRLGQDFDLEVLKGSSLRDSQIQWSIADTSILVFDDGECYGDDVELIAKNVGTTKVTCKNLVTGGKLIFKVTVTY